MNNSMIDTIDSDDMDPDFVNTLVKAGADRIRTCIQCGTCSSVCPSGRRTAFRTREIIRKAFKLAEIEKPGATHFELPEDIAKLNCDYKPIPPRVLRRPAPDYKAIIRALDLIKGASKPLIIAANE